MFVAPPQPQASYRGDQEQRVFKEVYPSSQSKHAVSNVKNQKQKSPPKKSEKKNITMKILGNLHV